MTKEEMFFGAKWVCAGEYASTGNEVPDANGTPHFPVLRGKFTASSGDRVTLRVVGLGFFHCYINGKEVTTQKYLPLATDYEPRNGYPSAETLFGHRLYVPQFDVTDLVHDGENTVAVHFGGGWYTYEVAGYGDPKAIYDIAVENVDGVRHFGSSEKDKIGDGFVKTYYFTTSENHDYTDFDDACFGNDFDDSAWQNAVLAAPLETEYLQTNCPCDAEMQEIPFEFLDEKNGEKV
ncbi:MAG: alpha-L-rhamnosidase N-terminal domain-containing protein, partial [Clostridia bacterium]|nr:alpha-L-rhamnosidase N-terminal domain-containing protein [Clostridia bacterium]